MSDGICSQQLRRFILQAKLNLFQQENEWKVSLKKLKIKLASHYIPHTAG